MPVLDNRPVVVLHGSPVVLWSVDDYCVWAAVEKGWTRQQTMAQPIGLLDRTASAALAQIAAHEAEMAKLRR